MIVLVNTFKGFYSPFVFICWFAINGTDWGCQVNIWMCGPMCHNAELDISIALDREKIGHQPMRTGILIKLNQTLQEKGKNRNSNLEWSVFKRKRWGSHNGSVVKVLATESWWSSLDPQKLYKCGRGELILQNHPMISTCLLWHMNKL